MKNWLIFILLLLPNSCSAQLQGQPLIDSLLKMLPQITEDSDLVKVYYSLSNTYKTIDPDQGIAYGNKELELSLTLDKPALVALAYNNLGLNYQYKSAYTTALEYFHKAIVLLAGNPEYLSSYGSIISHLAVIYQDMGDPEKALEYNLKALDIDLKLGNDSVNIAGDYGNIGILYLGKHDYEKALEYDFKSLAIFEHLNNKDGIAHNYGNIGNVYTAMKNFPRALEYDNKALALFRELGDKGGIALNLGNIGVIYVSITKDMDSSRHSDNVVPNGTRGIFLSKGIEYLKQSIALSKELGQLDNIIEFSESLHYAYMLAGNYEAALESYKEYVTLKDSVFSQENKLKVAQLETERELALKDKEIQITKLEVAKKRVERIILILSLLLLIGVLGVVVRLFRAQKKYNMLLSREKKAHLDRIEKQKTAMSDIAYTHAHEVSGQVSTILGLVEVFNLEDYADTDNKVVLDGIADTARKLDIIVKDMIRMENRLNSEQKNQ